MLVSIRIFIVLLDMVIKPKSIPKHNYNIYQAERINLFPNGFGVSESKLFQYTITYQTGNRWKMLC